jgi:hypothetical protein
LKVPEGTAGKKARCKKCKYSFHIPGEPTAPVDPVDDSEHLSVIDSPFSFAAPAPAKEPAKKEIPPPSKEVNKKPGASPAAGDNPFAVATAAATDDPTPIPSKEPGSKSKYQKKAEPAAKKSSYRGPKPAAGGGGKGRTVLFLFAALLCAAGGAGGFHAFTEYQKSKESKPAATPVVAAAPAPEPQPVAEKPKEEKAKKTDDRARKANKEADKVEPAAAGAPADKRDAAPQAKRGGPKVTGGLKLPAPAAKPTPYEKATATIPLDHDAKAVKQLILGGSEGPVIVVVRRTSDGLGGMGRKDTLDRFALNTNRKIDSTVIPADAVKGYPRAGDISPGGDRYAYEHPAGKLSVAQLGTDTKLLDGLAISDDEKEKHPGIAALYFLTDDKVAVVTTAGVVETWDIAAKKKVASSEPIPAAANLADKRSLALHRHRDPEKATLFAFAGGAIHAVHPGGKPTLALTLPKAPSEGLALAVDPSGQRLAVAFRATDPGNHVRFVHARVGDPKPAADQPLDADLGTPTLAEWTRPETFTLLTDKGVGFAFDAEANVLIAGLRTPAPTHVVADGVRHWVLLPNAADAKKAVLVNVTVPPEGYSQSLTGAKWQPFSLAITADGTAK